MNNTIVELRAAKIPGWSGFFADHHWVLVIRGLNGKHYESCDRWEVWQHANQNDSCWGHLHKNLLAPCQGVGNGPSRAIKRWTDDDALEIIAKIESAQNTYPFNEKYCYWPGPNSNTFAQWVIGDRMKLGIRAFGKRYSVPEIFG
jgi:hypothetical protein